MSKTKSKKKKRDLKDTKALVLYVPESDIAQLDHVAKGLGVSRNKIGMMVFRSGMGHLQEFMGK